MEGLACGMAWEITGTLAAGITSSKLWPNIVEDNIWTQCDA